jgi:hypothetical protein
MITKAILDRILHHTFLFNIADPSYRVKDKMLLNVIQMMNHKCTLLFTFNLTFIIVN